MSKRTSLAVVGAGPAGISAAITASEAGVDTVLVDAGDAPGGQVYRPMPATFQVTDAGALGDDHAIGESLRRALARSRVEYHPATQVWSAGGAFRLDVCGVGGRGVIEAEAVIAATGTSERIVPCTGWTLPGVVGLGAATIMLKSQHILPGEATVVAGAGPLVAAVAAGILSAGGRLAAVIDLTRTFDWVVELPALLARPDLVRRGLRWWSEIRASGAPVLERNTVTRIHGTSAVTRVDVSPVDSDWRPIGDVRSFDADAVAIGHGLVPSVELTRLLRAAHRYDAARGGWTAERNRTLETTVPGLFVAGDAGGVSGAAAAGIEGELAGLAAAHRLGAVADREFASRADIVQRRLETAAEFGAAMSRMMQWRSGQIEGIAPDAIVCRCEDVRRRDIERALELGAGDLNELKSWTRCGMGPCQGRMCGETAAEIVAARVGSREAAGSWTVRAPITPVTLDDIVGAFDYTDIPQPQPAPQ